MEPVPHVIQWLTAAAVIGLFAYIFIINRRQSRFIRRGMKPQVTLRPHDHSRALRQLYSRLAALESCFPTPPPLIPFHAEWGEDIFLYELFGPSFKGRYVEVGALDGASDSVTLTLDRLGWDGILIEPTPRNFERCTTNRPRAIVRHAALGGPGSAGMTTFLVPRADLHTRSAFREHDAMNTDHLSNLKRAGAEMESVQVPLTTLTAVAASAGWNALDVAVIDVEGAEFDLLRGFDLAAIRTRVLIIEDNSLGRDPRAHQLMLGQGYLSPLWVGANRVYIRADEPSLLKRAEELRDTMYSPFVRAHTDHIHDARLRHHAGQG